VEFAGDDLYAPVLHPATAGTVELTAYTEDESITAKLEPVFEAAGEDGIRGRAPADLCTDALDWPLAFGTGEDGT
jgi:hypothetical protein